MKINFIWGTLAIAGLSFISSCKDDETPVAGISFEVEEQEVTESDGTFKSFHPDLTDEDQGEEGEGRVIEVSLVLDRPLAGDVVIDFDVDGTASNRKVGNNPADFIIAEEGVGIEVDGDEITLLKGVTEAAFKVIVYEDLDFEYEEDQLNDDDIPYETVVLSLESIVSGPAKLGAQIEHTLFILEDDLLAGLQWESQDMDPADANVDMDVLFSIDGTLRWGSQGGVDEFETIFVPAGLGEGDFGVSYTYYAGLSNDLDFVGYFFTTAGKLDGDWYTEDPLLFEGTYTLANVNAWSASSPPKIAVTMNKEGIHYDDISNITIHSEKSRLKNGVTKSNTPFKLDRSVLKNIKSPVTSLKGLAPKK